MTKLLHSKISERTDPGVAGNANFVCPYDRYIMEGWRHYLKYQSEDVTSGTPNLSSKMRYYAKAEWESAKAWSDFQKILTRHQDAIHWE